MERSVDPEYEYPAESVVEMALLRADDYVDITGWRIIPLRVSEIIPRENIHMLNKSDFKVWKADLIEIYRSTPGLVSPIVVAKRKGKYIIIDGHHRWRSAKFAHRKALWVVQVKGALKEPGLREKQERWI